MLSCVPTSPDTKNPLPLAEAALTVNTVNQIAKSQRSVMHAFVMPNRGSGGNSTPGVKPLYLDEEMELMHERARALPEHPARLEDVLRLGRRPERERLDARLRHRHGASSSTCWPCRAQHPQIPPVVATHKGFALPGFDQRAAQPRDIGPAAKAYPGVRFLVYHSGYDTGDRQRPYARRRQGDARTRTRSTG